MKPCHDLNVTRGVRCVKEAGHDQLHRAGLFAWGSQNEPTRTGWVQRALDHRLPYRIEGGAVR